MRKEQNAIANATELSAETKTKKHFDAKTLHNWANFSIHLKIILEISNRKCCGQKLINKNPEHTT